MIHVTELDRLESWLGIIEDFLVTLKQQNLDMPSDWYKQDKYYHNVHRALHKMRELTEDCCSHFYYKRVGK